MVLPDFLFAEDGVGGVSDEEDGGVARTKGGASSARPRPTQEGVVGEGDHYHQICLLTGACSTLEGGGERGYTMIETTLLSGKFTMLPKCTKIYKFQGCIYENSVYYWYQPVAGRRHILVASPQHPLSEQIEH